MQEFDAFISYCHAADGRLAQEIQRGLQRLTKSLFQRRALRVFRDETGLSTNPHLWGSIESALAQSNWFVLLASPEAASSDWVARELTTWLANHPLDHLLTVVTDGEIGFLPDAGVDRAATTCLPAPLIDALDNEPRWLDMRWARADAQLDLRNGRFRAAMADLAAPIHGVPKDDLEGEDVRQQKRARQLALGGITAVAMFAIVSLIAAFVAVDRSKEASDQRNVATARQVEAEVQRQQAEAARADAEASENVAIARGLAAQAATVSAADIDLGLLLGAEGYRRDPSLDTRTGLLTALDNARGVTELVRNLPSGIVDLEISPDRSTAYASTGGGDVWAIDTSTWTTVGEPLLTGIEGVAVVDASADGGRLAVAMPAGVSVLDLASNRLLASGIGGSSVASMTLNDDGTLIAIGDLQLRTLRVLDVDSQAVIFEGPGEVGVFLPDRKLAVGILGSTYHAVYSIDGDATPIAERDDLPPGGGLAISPDGTVLVVGGLTATAMMVDATTLEPLGPVLAVRGSRTGDFFFNPEGTLMGLGSDDGSVRVFDVATSAQVLELTGMTGAVWSEFTGDTSLISASFYDDAAVAWDANLFTQLGEADTEASCCLSALEIVDDGAQVVMAVATDVRVANSADTDQVSASRSLGNVNRALSVAENAGVVAAYTLEVDDATGELLDRKVHIMRLPDLTEQATIIFGENAIENIALSPDGTMVAVGLRSGDLTVYDATTGDLVLEPLPLDKYPCCIGLLVWNADGTRLHAGGQDGTLRTLDTSTWEVLSEHVLAADQTALRLGRLTEDGTKVIVPTEAGTVYLVDAETGEPVGEPYTASGAQLQNAVIIDSGTVLVAVGRDGKMRLWDIATHLPIGPALAGHLDYTQALDSLSDTTVMSGGATDGRTITWNLDPAAWAERACELAGRNLTRPEWDRYVGGEYQRTCQQWPEGE